jgi:hypothetical protein
MLAEVRLHGAEARITRIEYDEAPGDRTVITIRESRP